MKILIVDDNSDVRAVLRQIVEHYGHDALEAGDGIEGLELAARHKPDAIISDGLMPRMDGYQFLRALKQDKTLNLIPFVFFTAIYIGDKEYELALSLGADALIIKPKAPDDFWKEFTSALKAHASKKKPAAQTQLPERPEKEEEYLRDYCRTVAFRLEEKVGELERVIADHERTKSTLLESEARYRLLFENNPHPMWMFDLETLAFLTVNDTAVQKYGYSREEFLSMTVKDIRPVEDVPALLDIVSKVSEGFHEVGIWRHRKKDGTIIDVEIAAHTLTFGGRRANLILAIDVTELGRMNREIMNSVNEWQNTFNAMSEAIALMDRDGKILRCNRTMADLVGKDFSEIVGRQCWEIVHGTSGPIDFCPHEIMKMSLKRETLVTQQRNRWFDVTVDPYFDSEGSLLGAVHIMKDITERKQMEDALKAAVVRAEDEKARAESIIEAIGDGITIQDRDFKILYQNQMQKNLVGDHIGELCYMEYEKREQQCEGCPVTQVFKDGAIHTSERTAPTDKGIVHVEVTASPLRDSTGRIIAGIEVVRNITERKKNEEALQEQRAFTENLIQNSSVATFVLSAQHTVLFWNRACEELTGYPASEMLGTNAQWKPFYDHERPVLADIVMDEDPEKLSSLYLTYTKSLLTPHGLHAERWFRDRNGRERYIVFEAAPIYNAAGKIIAAIQTLQDITERKRAEEALTTYSRELAALTTASNTLMLITNPEDIYQEICDIIYSVFDIKMAWIGVVGEDSFEVRPIAHCGSEDGYLSSIRVTWDDSQFSTGPIGMAIKTKKPVIININDPAFAMWEAEAQKRGYETVLSVPILYAGDKCLGAITFYSSAPDYFTPDRVKLCQIFANQAGIAIENARLVSGLEKEVAKRTQALEDTNIELQQLNKELLLRREEAEAASRSKTDFLANMSHELRTPLNAILGFADIMQMGMAGPVSDKQMEFLNDISTSGTHLLELITDILDLSKIEAGKMELESETFKLKELFDASLIMFKEKASKHGIIVTAEIDDSITSITADKRKLKQVIVNLLSNAFKFTPDGGSVRVTARRVEGSKVNPNLYITPPASPPPLNLRGGEGKLKGDGDFVEISVTDTGIGISEENQQRLFQPFQQIETSLTRKFAGTGLGLSLCRRFVELHNGRIWVESEEGKGSRFAFVIPINR